MFDTPCTQALWEAVMGNGSNPSRFKRENSNRPMENVTWSDCQAFMERLTELLDGRLILGLPSEAQWEYACRSGTTTPRYDENLTEIAWYGANSGGETHLVRQKTPNAWGLYDMLGNVWECCDDALQPANEQRTAPEPDGPTHRRVLRGGSWSSNAGAIRAAFRRETVPGARNDDRVGFRCAEFRRGISLS
jgi:formylglycine-generating enzyme required for sulfatase activity